MVYVHVYEYIAWIQKYTATYKKLKHFACTMKIVIADLDITDCNSMLNNDKANTLFKFHKNKLLQVCQM